MKFNSYFEKKENINSNYQNIIFSKKLKTPINYFLEVKTRNNGNNEQINKNIVNTTHISKRDKEKNINCINNNDEDLEIELISTSKKIPINNYVGYITTGKINEEPKGNIIQKKRPKIRRVPSANSFFDDIQNDNSKNNLTNDNTNIFSEKEYLEFNLTNFGLVNRPKINQNNSVYKKDEYINTNADNSSIYNEKNDFPIKRHNSVISSNVNKILNINNEISFLNNNNNNQFLYDEIQRLKKENKRLVLKNNELALKIRTQEIKTKVKSKNINQKKLSTQKEEFLLQKIKKLESEIIKQKDLITKLTYNKRFNIGIRKIRVNSILIKGNNSKLKKKNSINNFRLGNLYCNKTYKNNKDSSIISDLNRTLPNKTNKFVKTKTNSFKQKREDLSIHVRPSFSSISSSSPKNIHKNEKNIKMNTTMTAYNKDNSINLKIENIDISKNLKKKLRKEINFTRVNKSKIEEKKINDEYNIDNRIKMTNDIINNCNYKKIGPHKTYGKTSLIMSVINDNLLGNFNLSQYMNEHSNMNNNKNYQKRFNLKRNSIF